MKAIGTGMALVVFTLLLIGCGVPQEKYDLIVAERDTAKSQVVSVQGDLDKAKAQVASVQSDLDKAKAQAISMQGDLDKAKAQVTSLQGDLDKAKAQVTSLQSELSNTNTKYSDLVSSTTKQIDSLKRLTFFKMLFCSAKPAANSYTVQPDNTYRVGQTVYPYVEFIGIKQAVADSKLKVDYQVEFRLLDDTGGVVNRWLTTDQNQFERPFSYSWYYNNYTGLKAGNYALEVSVQDRLSGETVTLKGTFKVTA